MRFKTLLFLSFFLFANIAFVGAQQDNFNDDKKKKNQKKTEKIDFRKGLKTGVQVAEFAILIYGNLRGRFSLNQVRKTTVELGKIKTIKPDGSFVNSEYETRIKRAESLEKEKIRIYQKFPDARYSLIYDGKKVFGLYNNSVFSPTEDALKAFENRIWRGPEALLRYKENGSTCKLVKEDKILGVTLYVVEVTDKQERKTTFFISKKSLRVMMLEYEDGGVKYRRKFYDHNPVQGTLVPFRSVLWADDKIIEEKDVSTITYGQTIDESIFESPVAGI